MFVETDNNMFVLSKEQSTYFEQHADEILKDKGVSKAQFAKALGVAPQNINKLLGTKNALTLSNISSYLNIPLRFLLFGNAEKERDIHGCIYIDGIPHLINGKDDIETLLHDI